MINANLEGIVPEEISKWLGGRANVYLTKTTSSLGRIGWVLAIISTQDSDWIGTFWKLCIEARLAASEKSSALTPAMPVKSRGRLGGKHGRNSGGNPSEQLQQSQHMIKNGGGTGWNWEVVLGGTGILTPKQFVMNLKNLVEH